MADFSRDQDFLDVSPLSISQRHEPGLICTLPDFHERRSQYDIIGIPDFGNMDTSALTPGQLVPPAAASCTNYNILGNYKSLTHGLERSYGSNVHAGCFGDHDQSNVGMKEKWPRLPNPCELAYIHHPATLIASTPPNPTVVASDEKSNYNSQQQLAGRDCEPREGSTQNQCHNGLTDLKQSPPSSPKPGPDQLIGTESTECKKRKNNQFLGSGAGQERKELHPTPKEAKNRTKRFRSCSSSKCRKGSCSGNAESLSKAKQKPEPPTDYIHVRARRGQATDSHSLAERVRREKISERMKTLQDLVPGCNKVTGKAVVLDEIINYVQSLQKQVEFLSMKLASLNVSCDHFGLLDDFLEPSQGLLILQGSGSSTQPMTVYEAVAGNCIEGYRPLMQHQTPCALDAAFPAAMAGYNSLIYRPRST